jgi:hypothetical protein
MLDELKRTDDWSEFMQRMCHGFERSIEANPTCVADIVQELRKRDASITCLDLIRDRLAEVKDADLRDLPTDMHRHGYYASAEGPWLVCSKSKKQQDTMLFAAKAAQVLSEANLMLVHRSSKEQKESPLAA